MSRGRSPVHPPSHPYPGRRTGRQEGIVSGGGVSGEVQVKVRRARGGKANTTGGKQGLRSAREEESGP